MKNLFKKSLCLLVTLCMVLSLTAVFAQAANSPRVFILGDSTAETKKGNAEHLTGWGEVLHNFFEDPYMIKNYAVSGESSKHFYKGYWSTSIKGQVKKGDYVIIQFGHNDIKAPSVTGDMGETTTNWSYYTYPSDNLTDTDSNGCYSFGYYLNQYVTEIRAAGAYPIFVTSIERRKDAYISADPEVSPHSQLAGYMKAMNSIAEKLNVPVIDVYTKTRTEILKLSYNTLNPWFLSYYGGSDDTHLTEEGAMAVAEMVAQGIKDSQDANVKGLAAYVKDSFSGITNVEPPFYFDTDFEGGTEGNNVSGYDGWFFTDTSPDKDVKYKKETLQDGTTNIYANFTATAEYVNNDRVMALLERNFTGLNDDYVHFSYKLRSDSANNGSFLSILNGSTGYTEFYTVMNSSSIAGVNFKDSEGNAMTTGKWYQYDYYINTKTGDLSLKVDGRSILKHKVYEKLIGLNQIRLGFVRTTPVVDNTAAGEAAAVAIDDLSLYLMEESEFNEATGVLPSNVVLKESFEDGFNGDSLSSTLSPGWSYVAGGGNGGASYAATYWKEPNATPSNTAMLFTNSDTTKQALTYTSNNITDITSGYVHVGWRMQAVSQAQGVTCYFNPSGYNGTLVVSTKDFAPGTWYDLDAYINIETKEFTLYRGKVVLYKNKVIDNLANGLTSVSFSMYRKDNTYQIAFDDFIVESIPRAEYNEATGVLAENVIFSEKGNFVESGTALATSATEATNAYSNFYAPSDYKATTWIKFADGPTDKNNTALNFGRSIASPQNATETMKRDISPAITDGFHSLSLKLYSKGENNSSFNIGAVDDAGQSCSMALSFSTNTVITRTFYPTSAGLSSAEGSTEVTFLEGWNDVEIIFDLRNEDYCKLTLYINGEAVLSNVNWGYYPAHDNTIKNNGSIKQIFMGVPGDRTGSTNGYGDVNATADVSWFADDIIMQSVSSGVAGIVNENGYLTAIKVNAGWKPSSSDKFLVAVYNTEDGEITSLKNLEIVTVSDKGENQKITLADPVELESEEIVKVFYWNMTLLKPIISEFSEIIN